MKIRIQDNSVRFRLTLREVEELERTGFLERTTQIVGPDGLGPRFCYAVDTRGDVAVSFVKVECTAITLCLCARDRETLLNPEEEGAYIRHEWISPEGAAHRFMAFIEKDRPGSTCVKKEAWIYDAPHGGPLETRPIPVRSGG